MVGAALSRSGLGRRTALGATALIVGANLPDLDALAYFDGPAPISSGAGAGATEFLPSPCFLSC